MACQVDCRASTTHHLRFIPSIPSTPSSSDSGEITSHFGLGDSSSDSSSADSECDDLQNEDDTVVKNKENISDEGSWNRDDVDGGTVSCRHNKLSRIVRVRSIEAYMIPNGSRVVFDWDNTLKLVNQTLKKTVSRVSSKFLQCLQIEKGCELFIISAIRPSQMNIDTLLIEVDKLGFTDIFCPPSARTAFGKRKEIRQEYHWVQEGNIIICGYDKAEVFKAVVDGRDGEDVTSRPVVFFDDEEVNIVNFSNFIQGSLCYAIEGTEES